MDYPVGTILPYAGDITPTSPNWIAMQAEGWEFCDGGEASRTTYSDLFSVIGITWGAGNTTTTFNLPDLRGQFIRGCDKLALQDPDRATRYNKYSGGNTGDKIGTYQFTATKLPNTDFSLDSPGDHTHSVSNLPTDNVKSNLAGTGNNVGKWAIGQITGDGGDHTHSITGGGDNESRGPNAAVNFIIKALRVPDFIENTAVVTGLNILDSFSDLSGNGCVWDWSIASNDGLNMQAGSYYAVWNAASDAIAVTTGSTTPVIGTVDVSLSAVITGDNVCFLGTSTSDTWTVRLKRTLL